MNAVALMYHDVVPDGHDEESGFPGGDAAVYKITIDNFSRHLRTIASRVPAPPIRVDALTTASALPLLLTFDDGGASAIAAADRLEARGWRGHFFVTTDYIDRAGFLTRSAIRDLHDRGHVIGGHSCSHPLRMAHLPDRRLRDEWTRSVAVLQDLIGAPIDVASVPGGHYSPRVADIAAEAGVRVLFTSQPTVAVERRGDLMVIGRYAVWRSMSAREVAAIAAGSRLPRFRRSAAWAMRRVGKAVAGKGYLKARAWWLGASDDVRWGDVDVNR